MSFETFFPVPWATELNKDLDKVLVFAENTNRQYEGLVRNVGDSVKILGIGKPSLTSYSDGKLHEVPTAEKVQGTSMTMPINQVEEFNFYVGDLDKAQAKPKGLLSQYMTEVRDQIATKQDAFIAKLHAVDTNVAKITKTSAITKSNILSTIDEALLALLENDVSRSTNITLTCPPWFTMMLKNAYVELDTDNSEMMKNGRVGRYSGVIIKESNQVYNDGTYDNIQVKTDRAISFVKPYIHLEPYRPDEYFEDAVKGWALYDGKVTRPKEIINLQVKK